MAKSPLTRCINDSLSSSYFALAGKRTGYDAFVIVGAASSPTLLIIDPTGVRFEPADDLWGQSSRITGDLLRARLGKEFRVVAIGPAGENQVHFATLSHDGRHAGRGGLAVSMGSKKLKAIAAAGDRLVPTANPVALTEYARRLSADSLGPATAKYRELGTVSNLVTFNRLGSLPTRNFQQSTFAGSSRLDPEEIRQRFPRARVSCAACTIGCEHLFTREEGGAPVRLEYETLFALGPLCGIDDPAVVLDAAAYCDEAGIDTISAGVSVAFAMECAEKGLLDEPELQFGSGPALLQTLHLIARRQGVGALLSLGVREAARKLAKAVTSSPCMSRGWNFPVTNRGACRPWLLALLSVRAVPIITVRASIRSTCRRKPTVSIRDSPRFRLRSRPKTKLRSWTHRSSASFCAESLKIGSPPWPRSSGW